MNNSSPETLSRNPEIRKFVFKHLAIVNKILQNMLEEYSQKRICLEKEDDVFIV